MTRLPPSRAGEHTDGRTRTVFQHCDATMCTSTRRGREKTTKVRARSGAVRPHESTIPPPAALASQRSTQMSTAAQARGAAANPIRPKGQARRDKKPETHKTRPSDKKAGRPRSTLVAAWRNRRKRILQHVARSCNGLGRPRRPNEAIKTRERLNSKRARAIKKRVGPAARSSPQGDEDASSFRGTPTSESNAGLQPPHAKPPQGAAQGRCKRRPRSDSKKSIATKTNCPPIEEP